MFKLCSGGLPGSVVIASRLCVCVLMLMLGACASPRAQYRVGSQTIGASQQMRVAGYRKAAQPIELEDDGIEAQTPPLARRLKNEPDDPSEPFSPNYGTAPRPDNFSDDEDVAGVGKDAFDPFLDGPQWKHYEDDHHERRNGDVIGSHDAPRGASRPDFSERVALTGTGVAPLHQRPGFLEKRRGYPRDNGFSNSYF